MFTSCPVDLFSQTDLPPYVVEAEMSEDYEHLFHLLLKWQKVQNLVSRETLSAYWTRHIVDSVQLIPLISNNDSVIIDLGSGGGFPAIPLAIALKAQPNTFHLVESNGRKVSFLRTAAREFELSVTAHNCRIEGFDSRETGKANLITARALASLSKLLVYAEPLLEEDGRLLFHKGREYVEEIKESRALWDFDVVVIPSNTDPDGVLLEIKHLQRKSFDQDDN